MFFASNHFCCHMSFMHCLVSQHRLPHHVTNGINMINIGFQLSIHINEASFIHLNSGLIRIN